MKKEAVSLIVAFLFCILIIGANADDTGIIIIGGPETEQETVTMEDFKVGDTVEIPGFAKVTLEDVWWMGSAGKYNTVTKKVDGIYDSGDEAAYLCIYLDVLNAKKERFNIYNEISDIVCTYDDEYQFGGWVREVYFDQGGSRVWRSMPEGRDIEPMYRGMYCVVVTLPNDIFRNVQQIKTDDYPDPGEPKPLQIEFKIGDNEFTYIWRK